MYVHMYVLFLKTLKCHHKLQGDIYQYHSRIIQSSLVKSKLVEHYPSQTVVLMAHKAKDPVQG